MSFEDLSREQLLELIDEFLEQHDRRSSELNAQAHEQKQLIQELRLYQVELEMHNRELRQVQLDLEEARDRYSELFEHAPIAYLALDDSCRIERANDAAATLLRLPTEQLLGRSLLELTGNTPELAHLLARSSHRAVGTESELILHVKGERVDVEVMVTSSYDPRSGARIYRCALLDIGARKRAERERDRALCAERALHGCFQTLDQIHLAVGGMLATPDPARLEQLLGVVVESVLQLFDGRSAAVIIESPRHGSPPLRVFRGQPQASSSSVSLSEPLQIFGRRMGEIYVSFAPSAPAAQGQTTTEYGKTLALIASRLALGLELASHHDAEAEERRRLLWLDRARQELGRAPEVDGVLTAIRHCTASAASELTVASATFVRDHAGLRVLCAAHRDPRRERATRRLARLMRGWLHEQLSDELSEGRGWLDVRRGASFARWAAVLGFEKVLLLPLRSRQRNLGVMCFALDGTASEANGELTRTLEELSVAASTALDTAQLLEELRGAVEARDTLLALVAHDLRSPLNAISLTASSLSEPPPHRERRRSAGQLELIQRSIQRMSHLIDDLLTAANIESGEFSILQRNASPSELTHEACALNNPQALTKRITLHATAPRELPEVHADRERVLQVLTNLIVNALKFSPAGGTVEVRAELGGDCVRFSVRDQGPGLSSDQVPQVFRRYWRGKSGRSGLGLGLFIAERIVGAHHGKIWCESTLGQGAVFYFTLPLVAEARTSIIRGVPSTMIAVADDVCTAAGRASLQSS